MYVTLVLYLRFKLPEDDRIRSKHVVVLSSYNMSTVLLNKNWQREGDLLTCVLTDKYIIVLEITQQDAVLQVTMPGFTNELRPQ
jgi:hypothetical protein